MGFCNHCQKWIVYYLKKDSLAPFCPKCDSEVGLISIIAFLGNLRAYPTFREGAFKEEEGSKRWPNGVDSKDLGWYDE